MVPGRLPYMYVVLYLGVLIGFFHAAWASPCWVFPHWLDSVQHPIPQGDGAYEFIYLFICMNVWITGCSSPHIT